MTAVLASPATTSSVPRSVRWFHRPVRTTLRLLPVAMAAMVVIDIALGDRAEYFHAARLLQAWGELATGGSANDAGAFIVGQDTMGTPVSLAAGTAAFVVEPLAALAAMVAPAAAVARRRCRPAHR